MLNKVIMMGRIGNIETKTLPNGTILTKLSLAINEFWKDKDGVKQEKTTWYNIHGFQKLAEIMEKYTKKGDLVYVEGKLQQNKFTGQDGIEKTVTTILASEYKILSSKDGKDTSKAEQKPAKVMEPNHNHFHDDDIPW